MPPKAKAAKKKTANGYVMPDPLPDGEILMDTSKKQWKLGPSIGTGGFGEIYSAQEVNSGGKTYKYVVKIEPHENGPLFVEMHCYMRIAKAPDVEEFCKTKKLKCLGMPVLLGSGTHTCNGKKYRFIVMPKFGSDIWKLYLENKKQFPGSTAFKVGLQMLDVLEYIHSKGYIHADLKGANILLGIDKATKDQTYLVDFGLAGKYSTNKDFKPDPKNAHNGTIEYLSRDAHLGVQTRRGDLEVLGYNLIHWLGGVLPWEKNLGNPKTVQESKEASMKDVDKFLRGCFKNKTFSDSLKKYLDYVNSLDFDINPDYKKLHNILLEGLKAEGGSLSSPLQFKTPSTPSKRKSGDATAVSKKKQKFSDGEGTPKAYRTRRSKQKAEEVEEDDADEEQGEDEKENDASSDEDVAEETPKKEKKKVGKRRPKILKDNEEEPPPLTEQEDDKYAGYTREMIELQKKIDANRKTKKAPRKNAKKVAENGEKSENTNGVIVKEEGKKKPSSRRK